MVTLVVVCESVLAAGGIIETHVFLGTTDIEYILSLNKISFFALRLMQSAACWQKQKFAALMYCGFVENINRLE